MRTNFLPPIPSNVFSRVCLNVIRYLILESTSQKKNPHEVVVGVCVTTVRQVLRLLEDLLQPLASVQRRKGRRGKELECIVGHDCTVAAASDKGGFAAS